MDLTDDELKLSQQLQGYRFLIADPSPSRKTIRTLLSHLLIKPGNIEVADTFEDAEARIRASRPEFVFAEWTALGEAGAGSPLVSAQRDALETTRARAFFVITAKGSDSHVAGAAAEAIDAVLIKPFTFETLKQEVIRVLRGKVAPPPFDKALAEGKRLMEKGLYRESLEVFRQARDLATERRHRATAWFYEGTVFHKMDRRVESLRSFREAMVHEPAHYKSMVAMLEIHTAAGENEQAYAMAREIAAYHPVPTKLLPEFIRLSVANKQLGDLIEFYKYAEQAQADPVTLQHLSAGLAVCGLQFLKDGMVAGAVDAFRKAEVASKSDPRIMKRILCALVSAGLEVEAKAFMARATKEVLECPELKIAELEYVDRTMTPYRALEFAIRLLVEGTRAEKVYEVAIQRSVELGRKQRHIDDLVNQASRVFPERKPDWVRIATTTKPLKPRTPETASKAKEG